MSDNLGQQLNSYIEGAKAKTGRLFVVSGPSGAGKTLLCKQVMEKIPELGYSISYTTRPRRKKEIHGKDYFFVDVDKFKQMMDDDLFLEWAQVYGNYYGTSKEFVKQELAKGTDILLEIDTQGAKQIKQQSLASILIFVVPPSMEILEQRLQKRGTDSKEQIQGRLKSAFDEISSCNIYDYLVINKELDRAVTELNSIILAERCRNVLHI